MIKYLMTVFMLLCSMTTSAIVRYELRFINQEVIGTDFFFELYLKSMGDPMYLADSDIYLNFNINNFYSPDVVITEKGSSLYYYEIDTGIDNNNQIVVSIEQPDFRNKTEFNQKIAMINTENFGTYLGRVKISGIIDSDQMAGLSFYYYQTKGTDIYYLDSKSPWFAHRVSSYDIPQPVVLLEVKVFLEGPFNRSSEEMEISLNTSGLIPAAAPYDQDNRSITSIPYDAVDWVLVELRKTPNEQPVAAKSVFLHRDGRIVDDNGVKGQIVMDVPEGNYFIVIHHRNHLSVMSSSAVSLYGVKSTLYDFTEGSYRFYGNSGAKDLGNGVWGMIAGDGNRDGGVYVEDYHLYRVFQGSENYTNSDFNMDGGVYGEDYTIYRINQGQETEVP